jgi:hypothetical protein
MSERESEVIRSAGIRAFCINTNVILNVLVCVPTGALHFTVRVCLCVCNRYGLPRSTNVCSFRPVGLERASRFLCSSPRSNTKFVFVSLFTLDNIQSLVIYFRLCITTVCKSIDRDVTFILFWYGVRAIVISHSRRRHLGFLYSIKYL